MLYNMRHAGPGGQPTTRGGFPQATRDQHRSRPRLFLAPSPVYVATECQRLKQRVASFICESVRLIQLTVAISHTAMEVPFCSVTNTWEPGEVAVAYISFTAVSDNVVTVLITLESASQQIGCSECSVLPLPAPPKQTHNAEAGGEEWERGGERRGC
jgi:hypothetical protein